MTQQRVCVINVGSRGEKMGVLQLRREKGERVVSRRRGNGNRVLLPQTFSAWSRGGEKKAISYHNTLLIANCESVIVISILN